MPSCHEGRTNSVVVHLDFQSCVSGMQQCHMEDVTAQKPHRAQQEIHTSVVRGDPKCMAVTLQQVPRALLIT